jgi:hypothetical protein
MIRIAPAKKVIKPGPGSWRLPKPYFREQRAIPIPITSQKRLEDWSGFLIRSPIPSEINLLSKQGNPAPLIFLVNAQSEFFEELSI